MNSIHRRNFLKGAVGLAAASALPESAAIRAAASDAPPRPNILVFLTDDHGQWLQHVNGNSEVKTPNFDRLAARGVRMTHAFTPCPVCSPARASFFTGRTPSQHGIHDWIEETKTAYEHPWLKGQTLISELLKESGYHTGLVGKWHCGYEREPQPGFDRWFSYWVNQYPHKGKQRFSDQGKEVQEEGEQSPFLTKRAIDFLQHRRSVPGDERKPFFLVVGYTDTHTPHQDAPEDLVAEYKNATFKDLPDEPFAPCHGQAFIKASADPKIERARREQYYAAASNIDREMGKIIAELEAHGELDNTLVVYTGDHGLNAGHHGIWEKGNATTPQNFLEESIRIGCTIAWPAGGIAQNSACDDMVDHCDLFATLLDAAGVKVDVARAATINSPGRSYLPQLRGKKAEDWRTAQFCEYGNARMIRDQSHKLILRYPFKGVAYPNELYDLNADPRETINRYADPASAEVVKTLTDRLNQYFDKYKLPEHDGLALEQQPVANPNCPWARKPAIATTKPA